MISFLKRFFLLALSLPISDSAIAGLVRDFAPYPGEKMTTEIQVSVDNRPVFVHTYAPGGFYYVHFAFTDAVQVQVIGALTVSTVKPRALKVPAVLKNGNLRFTIDKPFNYVVPREESNDSKILLAIFAEAPMEEVPRLGDDGVRNIEEFGIDSTGRSLTGDAINLAIETISKEGGGTLFFPKGIYSTGTIFMKDNVQVWLDDGH